MKKWSIPVLIAIIGLLTVLQLARLRSAWMASARAMKTIKEYYRKRCPDAQLEQAFTWTNKNLPSPSKRGSVAFLLALSVMLVDGGAVMASVVFLGVGVKQTRLVLWLLLGLFVGLVFIGIQLKLYLDWVSK